MKNLKELEAKYAELGEEINRLKQKGSKSQIDFTKVPKDTLVEVRDYGMDGGEIRYFSHVDEDGCYRTFDEGGTSLTRDYTTSWDEIRLVENPPQPWFGGECPLPNGVEFKFWFRNGKVSQTCVATDLRWNHAENAADIIAYQVLGSEWQD